MSCKITFSKIEENMSVQKDLVVTLQADPTRVRRCLVDWFVTVRWVARTLLISAFYRMETQFIKNLLQC